MRTILLFLLALFATTSVYAQTPALTRDDVNVLIKEYLEKNGDQVINSIMLAQQKAQSAKVSTLINANTPTRGPANAPITIIEFSDFECPYCLKAQATLTGVDARYPGQIRWVYKNLPLSFHAMAKPAASAALAAKEQGKFWEYSKELWKRQEFLGEKLFADIAKELKLDVAKFQKDRTSPKITGIIAADMAEAEQIGARGTPYFLVNGVVLSGAQPEAAFVEVIEKQLKPKP